MLSPSVVCEKVRGVVGVGVWDSSRRNEYSSKNEKGWKGAAAFLSHPNILQAERDAREEALPDTRAQKYSTIEMVNQLKVVTPITLDDSFTMGVENISTESRVLGSIVYKDDPEPEEISQEASRSGGDVSWRKGGDRQGVTS
jgi:hypothetical protein